MTRVFVPYYTSIYHTPPTFTFVCELVRQYNNRIVSKIYWNQTLVMAVVKQLLYINIVTKLSKEKLVKHFAKHVHNSTLRSIQLLNVLFILTFLLLLIRNSAFSTFPLFQEVFDLLFKFIHHITKTYSVRSSAYLKHECSHEFYLQISISRVD